MDTLRAVGLPVEDRRAPGRGFKEDRPPWTWWITAALGIGLVIRLAMGALRHSCTSIPDIGMPLPGSPKAGFCSTFHSPWLLAAYAAGAVLVGVAVTRRRPWLGLLICFAVLVGGVGLAVAGSNLDDGSAQLIKGL